MQVKGLQFKASDQINKRHFRENKFKLYKQESKNVLLTILKLNR